MSIIITVLWLVSAVVNFGLMYPYMQGKWPDIARETEAADFWGWTLVSLMFGPCGLPGAAAILVVELVNRGRFHGFQLRRNKWDGA